MVKLFYILLFILSVCHPDAKYFQKIIDTTRYKTFYVDANNGNDNNNGATAQTPWKTLARVNKHFFMPGDKLLFRAGRIYNGQLKPKGSGSASKMVKVDQYGSGLKPSLKGNGLVSATLHLYNLQYWEFQNLAISNKGITRVPKRFGIHVEIEDFGTASSIFLKNIDVHDVNGSLVKKEGGGAGIVFSNSGNRLKSHFKGILIENCTIKRTARNGILINGYWERTNWHPNKNVIIRKNLIEGVPGDGIVPIGCDSAKIEYNVMRDCPRLLPDGEAAAGIWPWSSDNTIIQYNEVSDHKAPWDAQGFDADWNCKNTIIQYNFSHDNEGGFLLVCDDGSASKTSSLGNQGTIVRYNLSVNDGSRSQGKHAGFSPAIHVVGPVKNARIYNNVVYVTDKPAGADSTLVEMGDWSGIPDSTVFANNIFYVKLLADYNLSKSTRSIFQNNLYFGRHLYRPKDTAAVFADPGFVLSNSIESKGLTYAKNFKIKQKSPAINKGKRMEIFSIRDFFGNQIINPEMPTIGLHEFNISN